jgi:hypothetical protein
MRVVYYVPILYRQMRLSVERLVPIQCLGIMLYYSNIYIYIYLHTYTCIYYYKCVLFHFVLAFDNRLKFPGVIVFNRK